MCRAIFILAGIALFVGSFSPAPAQARTVFRVFVETTDRSGPWAVVPRSFLPPAAIHQGPHRRNRSRGISRGYPNWLAGPDQGQGPRIWWRHRWGWDDHPGRGKGRPPWFAEPDAPDMSVIPLPTSFFSLASAFILLGGYRYFRRRLFTGPAA